MVFDQHKSLLVEVNKAFATMKEQFPNEIRCKAGCDDCCNAFFDVSLIEAEFIRQGLRILGPEDLSNIKERAKKAKAKTEEYKQGIHCQPGDVKGGEVGYWRVRCPMLSDAKKCVIYEYRPVTCRAYGLPTSIGEKGHVCGFSAFDKGTTYPTVKLDQINTYLQSLSETYATDEKLGEADAQKRFFLYELVL